jgi:hypothetical protein
VREYRYGRSFLANDLITNSYDGCERTVTTLTTGCYDLFGGKHGPLRTLTRAATYGLMFFLGYVAFLPLRFSVIAAY